MEQRGSVTEDTETAEGRVDKVLFSSGTDNWVMGYSAVEAPPFHLHLHLYAWKSPWKSPFGSTPKYPLRKSLRSKILHWS